MYAIGVIGICSILFLMLIVPKYEMTKEIYFYTKGNKEKPTFMQCIQFATPMYNNVIINSCLYGSPGWVGFFDAIFGIGVVLVALQKFFFFSNVYFNIVITFVLILLFVSLYVVEAIIMFNVSQMMTVKKWRLVVATAFPFIGPELIVPSISRTFEIVKDETAGTFKGDSKEF